MSLTSPTRTTAPARTTAPTSATAPTRTTAPTRAAPAPTGSPVDRYVERLGAALRGPRRLRADLLAEIRSGLLEATEARCAQGSSRLEAEQQAVAEFGPTAPLARDFGIELMLAESRRTAMVAAVGFPAVLTAWLTCLSALPAGSHRGAAPGLSLLTDLVSLSCAVLALLGLAVLGRPRVRRSIVPVGRAMAGSVLVGLTAILALSTVMTVLDGSVVLALAGTGRGLFTLAFTGVAVVVFVLVSVRTLRTGHRPSPSTPAGSVERA